MNLQNPSSLVDTAQQCPRDHEESECTGHVGGNSSAFLSHSSPQPTQQTTRTVCTPHPQQKKSELRNQASCGISLGKHHILPKRDARSPNRTETSGFLLDEQLILKIVLHSHPVKGPPHHASTCLTSGLKVLYHFSRFSIFENVCFQKKKKKKNPLKCELAGQNSRELPSLNHSVITY